MAGPRGLRFRPEFVAHNAVHRRVAKLHTVLLSEPSLDLFIAGKSLRLGETFLELLHHVGWNRLLARIGAGLSDLLNLLETPFFVEIKPIGNGMAMDPQVASRRASAFRLPGLQQKQHVEAALDLGVPLFANEVFELLGRLGNLGKVVHDRRQCWDRGTIRFR